MATNAEKAIEVWKRSEGKSDGAGEWFAVDQTRINAFAEATLDKQFIHVDPEKSAQLSPFKTTIAHGYLTLSLVPYLQASVPMSDASGYSGLTLAVNYGLDKVRFITPVKVNSRVRATRELVSATLVDSNIVQLKQKITIEIEGEPKPACVAETLVRLYFAG